MIVPSSPASRNALAGWYVISLRPSGMHAPVRRAAEAHGARCIACAALRLSACADDRGALDAALAAPVRIFTSPAAVRFAARRADLRPAAGHATLAVGAGTARALARAGVDRAQWPERMDAEGLLALPALNDVGGRAVGLVTAPGGRGLIVPTLQARGAEVRIAHVYVRQPLTPTPARLARLAAVDGPIALLVSSAEAFDAFAAGLDERLRDRLKAGLAVASSGRLADRLRAAGFGRVAVAASARPFDMIDCVAEHAAHAPFR